MSQIEESDTNSKPKGNQVLAAVKESLSMLLMALALAWVIYTFIVQTFWIPTGSMEPTIMPGDRVLVAKFYYRFFPPRPGDIFVFKSPEQIGAYKPDLIKRIVATEGMTLKEVDGRVYVDGKPLKKDYKTLPDRPGADFGPYKVPRHKVFAMGDNRGNSKDSRYIGPIDRRAIIGRAFFIYWPPQHFGILR